MNIAIADCLYFEDDIAIGSSSFIVDAGLARASKADAEAACDGILSALKEKIKRSSSLPMPLPRVAWNHLLIDSPRRPLSCFARN